MVNVISKFIDFSADDDDAITTTPEPPTSTESSGTAYDEATQALIDTANAARTGDGTKLIR